MSNFTTINLKIKIKVPSEVEVLGFMNPTSFRNLLEEYQKKELLNILKDNMDAKNFWIGFLKYFENNTCKT